MTTPHIFRASTNNLKRLGLPEQLTGPFWIAAAWSADGIIAVAWSEDLHGLSEEFPAALERARHIRLIAGMPAEPVWH